MINNRIMKSFSEDGQVNLRSHANFEKSIELPADKNSTMSADTKNFIQKICYRKTASIDMTQYGFINDCKVNPVNYVIKPLREQLEKISVKPVSVKQPKRLPISPRIKARETASPTERNQACTPKSAMSYPGTHSSNSRFHKVRIQSDPSPIPAVTKEKKVRLVSPTRSNGEHVGRKNGIKTKKKK